jgi:TolB-like protein
VRYLFDDLCLDTSRRELRRRGELVHVEPQVFDLLEYLVSNRERLVTRDDLIASVWDGRIVSESALASRINAARTAIGDNGERQRLIKTIPRKGLRFVAAVSEEAPPAPELPRAPIALPDKPSIAVLPFADLSSDPAQGYFVDGIVEGITTGLCRIRSLFVIARNSSFTYRDRPVDVKQVGRELGVRYVLEGSVQRAGNRVRVGVQLVDATTGAHISADRFDNTLDDIFALQDEVATLVVGALSPRLEKAEIERVSRKPTESLDAYDLYLRALAAAQQWTRETSEQALGLIYRAVEADPGFAAAWAIGARFHNWRSGSGMMVDWDRETAEGLRMARRALELDSDDPLVLNAAAHAIGQLGREYEAAEEINDRALALDPSFAVAWISGGWMKVWRAEGAEAISRFARAMRLSPVDPYMFAMQAGIAAAHLVAGRDDQARLWAERALRSQLISGPLLRVAVASLALSGRGEAARNALAILRAADPGLRIGTLHRRSPWGPAAMARLVEGLRRAGLPE